MLESAQDFGTLASLINKMKINFSLAEVTKHIFLDIMLFFSLNSDM